jgi:cyclin-dependent kinase-like
MDLYETQELIGEGTYGVVIKARHKATGQLVAIKRFRQTDDDEIVKKTAVREIKHLKRLRHSNVINLVEAFRRRGRYFLVFEYMEVCLSSGSVYCGV